MVCLPLRLRAASAAMLLAIVSLVAQTQSSAPSTDVTALSLSLRRRVQGRPEATSALTNESSSSTPAAAEKEQENNNLLVLIDFDDTLFPTRWAVHQGRWLSSIITSQIKSMSFNPELKAPLAHMLPQVAADEAWAAANVGSTVGKDGQATAFRLEWVEETAPVAHSQVQPWPSLDE